MASGESKDERDKRVDKLWETLDTRKEGHIDLTGLKKGLKKIDHREFDQVLCYISVCLICSHLALKNADDMVLSVVREVDTNGDGRIDKAGKLTNTTSAPFGEGVPWPIFGPILITTRIPSISQSHRGRAMADVPEHRSRSQRRNRQDGIAKCLFTFRGHGFER